MARLNEPQVSMDTIETLRRRMLRQNRDLAKSNNIRALRIRELENECACMLSENLELRGRILELEKEVEDSNTRRIADHALAIKSKLEAQLTEWGTLLAGLGLEPPMKRHSPHIRRRMSKQRMSFNPHRPSPSQRRLRDVAKEVEELGHISEHKSMSRQSMNHEQILALRSEAEMDDSLELGPPPVSQFIDDEPTKVDSPTRPPIVNKLEHTPKRMTEPLEHTPKRTTAPPVTFPSPELEKCTDNLPSPTKKSGSVGDKLSVRPEEGIPKDSLAAPKESVAAQPTKTGAKRKLAVRDEVDSMRIHRVTDENRPPRVMTDRLSIREKAGGKTLKELASMRKEDRTRATGPVQPRKALAAKSTNNDVSSPKKAKSAIMDEVAAAKADFNKAKTSDMKQLQERAKSKPKSKNPPIVKVESISPPIVAPAVSELGTVLTDAALLSPSSPEPVSCTDEPRGGTPPPADISSNGETARPSRRNKAAISYAEPNLRDKMRRPSKALFDAVAGEGKYARRLSQCEPTTTESTRVKRESDVGESWKRLPPANAPDDGQSNTAPTSPLAGKGTVKPDGLSASGVTERRRRPSTAAAKSSEINDDEDDNGEAEDDDDIDVYDFTPSSPHTDTQHANRGKKGGNRRQSKSSRRFSAAVESDSDFEPKERGSRRRSMML